MTTLADTPDTSEILPEIFDSKESHLLLDIESSEWKRQKIDNATFISPIPLFDTDTRTETIYPLWIFDIAINKTNRIVQFQFKNSSGALGYWKCDLGIYLANAVSWDLRKELQAEKAVKSHRTNINAII